MLPQRELVFDLFGHPHCSQTERTLVARHSNAVRVAAGGAKHQDDERDCDADEPDPGCYPDEGLGHALAARYGNHHTQMRAVGRLRFATR